MNPRAASSVLYKSMQTSSMTASAPGTPPLDHTLSKVRVAAYESVGPSERRVTSPAATRSSASGSATCVAIPSSRATLPGMDSPSIAKRDALLRPTRSASRCSAPAMGSIAVVTSTHRNTASVDATMKSQFNASSKPPPKARPCTTATVGTRSASIARYEVLISATNVRNQFRSFPGHSRTSPPRLKLGPSARMTSTRMSLSLAS
jgi:hypothetical protein